MWYIGQVFTLSSDVTHSTIINSTVTLSSEISYGHFDPSTVIHSILCLLCFGVEKVSIRGIISIVNSASTTNKKGVFMVLVRGLYYIKDVNAAAGIPLNGDWNT